MITWEVYHSCCPRRVAEKSRALLSLFERERSGCEFESRWRQPHKVDYGSLDCFKNGCLKWDTTLQWEHT